MLLEFARDESSELSLHAIRMIGIGGDEQALAGLTDIYRAGNTETKESVLRAYLIAGDTAAVFEIAANATEGEGPRSTGLRICAYAARCRRLNKGRSRSVTATTDFRTERRANQIDARHIRSVLNLKLLDEA